MALELLRCLALEQSLSKEKRQSIPPQQPPGALLEAYVDDSLTRSLAEALAPDAVSVPPLLEDHLDIRPGWRRAIWEVSKLIFPFLARPPAHWLGCQHHSAAPSVSVVPPVTHPSAYSAGGPTDPMDVHSALCDRQSYLICETLEPPTTARLAALCRTRAVTMNALLTAALHIACARVALADLSLGSPQCPHAVDIVCDVAIDLRPHLDIPLPASSEPASWAPLIASVDTHSSFTYPAPSDSGSPTPPLDHAAALPPAAAPPSDGTNIWLLATSVRAETTSDSSLRHGYQTIGLLGWVSSPWSTLIASLTGRRPHGRTASASISNLGLVPHQAPDASPYRLGALRLTQFKQGEGPAVLLSIASCPTSIHASHVQHPSTGSGFIMTLSFSCLLQALDRGHGAQLVRQFMDVLAGVADGHDVFLVDCQ